MLSSITKLTKGTNREIRVLFVSLRGFHRFKVHHPHCRWRATSWRRESALPKSFSSMFRSSKAWRFWTRESISPAGTRRPLHSGRDRASGNRRPNRRPAAAETLHLRCVRVTKAARPPSTPRGVPGRQPRGDGHPGEQQVNVRAAVGLRSSTVWLFDRRDVPFRAPRGRRRGACARRRRPSRAERGPAPSGCGRPADPRRRLLVRHQAEERRRYGVAEGGERLGRTRGARDRASSRRRSSPSRRPSR